MKKILILAANPRGDLRLDREIRDLKKAIKRNKNSDQFAIEIELAVRPQDLQELLFDHQPYYEFGLSRLVNRRLITTIAIKRKSLPTFGSR